MTYDRELKLLLEDNKRVTKCAMILSIIVMLVQVIFAFYCVSELSSVGAWEETMLIQCFHLIVILMNLYVSQGFIKRIKAKQSSTVLVYLSSYITLFFYLTFLFVYAGDLPANIELKHLYLLFFYLGTDLGLLLFSWCIQKNIIARRDELFRFEAGGVNKEKKDDDLFDVRYLPEEYMSDIQDDTSDEEGEK